MKTTFMANAANIERKWYVVDAEGQTVGRLAAEVAKVLRGKNKPTYTPHVDTGDYVIVINAEKVKFTGKKLIDKTYFRHSGYQGGTTFTPAGQMLDRFPTRVLEHAIKGMLPHNRLGAQMYRKLSVYAGPEHPQPFCRPSPGGEGQRQRELYRPLPADGVGALLCLYVSFSQYVRCAGRPADD